MSRRTNYIVGLLLILATLAIIFAVGFAALPQLSGESGVVFTNPALAQPSEETAVISTDSEENLDTDDAFIVLPTKEGIAAPTAVIEDTGSSIVALDTSESIVHEQPVDEYEAVIEAAVVEDSAEVVEVVNEPVENLPRIEGTASEETWLFSTQDEQQGWLGIFFKEGAPVTIFGRSEDGKWLHVEHEVAVQGWVYANAIAPGVVDIAALPVSNYVGSSSQAVVEQAIDLTATPQQVAAVQSQAIATREPTWTPVPTVTPSPTGPWATKPPAHNPWVPTNTPLPTWTPRSNSIAAQPIATPLPNATSRSVATSRPVATQKPIATPRPTSTPWPTPTLWPTSPKAAVVPTQRPQATAFPTRTPAPLPSAQVAAPSNEPVPTQDADIAETNAIAWWHADVDSFQGNGGKWRFDIIVRVPTSFKYGFEMERLVRTVLRDQNVDGDDYFVLSVSGIDCGMSYSDTMIARQNGARMNVVNEFNLNDGAIVIRPPC